ncbi:hypothetical protein NQZ68_039386 [Dissostichus eleginoides]|nr:hypothetical protein NQZ68_039386 [Dissostichus eleginoides]
MEARRIHEAASPSKQKAAEHAGSRTGQVQLGQRRHSAETEVQPPGNSCSAVTHTHTTGAGWIGTGIEINHRLLTPLWPHAGPTPHFGASWLLIAASNSQKAKNKLLVSVPGTIWVWLPSSGGSRGGGGGTGTVVEVDQVKTVELSEPTSQTVVLSRGTGEGVSLNKWPSMARSLLSESLERNCCSWL